MQPEESLPKSDDVAFDTQAICKRFGASRWTIIRWRERHGFPQPDFFIGTRGFTWRSTLDAWAVAQPKVSPLGDEQPPQFQERAS